VAAAWLALGLWLAGDYGPVWDTVSGEYPWGERWLAALERGETDVLAHERHVVSRSDRPPHPDLAPASVHPFPWCQVWTVGALLSAASCRVFWDWLGWLPALTAHNLPILLLTAALLATLVVWSARRYGNASGLLAAAFLILSPRVFADAANNLKDVPEACLYTFALLAGFAACTTGRRTWWAWTGLLAAAALAQKANALFLPAHFALFLAWALLRRLRGRPSGVVWAPGGIALALASFAAAYLALSPQFWHDTGERLLAFYRQVADVGRAPSAQVSLDGVRHVLWTTPPVVLALALAGAASRRLAARERAFLLLGVLVPIGRTALPGMRNFDGVRHFLEFMPCLALLAGIGTGDVLAALRALAARGAPWPRLAPAARAAAALALVAPVATQAFATHPHGVCYFNALVGGLRGARERGVADAGDYWGQSYWQGLDWLAAHAEPGAAVAAPIAAPVLAAAAPLKLRPDLRLADPRTTTDARPLYVMFVLRPGWTTPLTRELLVNSTPCHALVVQGAPILHVYRRAAGEQASATLAALALEPQWLRARFQQWLGALPEVWPLLLATIEVPAAERERARSRFVAALPAEFHPLLPELDSGIAAARAALGR
jgi:hypothetical protein